MTEQQGRGGDRLFWAALNQVEGIGAAAMLRLVRAFGSPEAALRASPEELMGRGRLSLQQAAGVGSILRSLGLLEEKMASWARAGIHLTTLGDSAYPARLLDLRAPPPLLYVRGQLLPEDSQAVAVVGTREPTPEGERTAEALARGLTERGFTDVSGLARGIDTAGHRGALSAPGGRTIAILGCGLLRVYPPENAGLAEEIVQRGCLISEVPPEAEVSRLFLLARDRIQAALARAVIVVQALRECGSIVTATQARTCGRLLFGVPWSDPPFAEGWEKLRRMGARPIDRGSDLDAVAREITSAEPSPQQLPLL